MGNFSSPHLISPPITPQGRLTLSSGAATFNTSVNAAANVYYTLYIGNMISLWDGSKFAPVAFAELTNVPADSSVGKAGPAAAAAASVYDLYAWSDSGTVRLTRSPAWTGANTRGTGAGTAQIVRVNGLLTNAVDITNGPAVGYGTYVGTIMTDAGAGTVTSNLGSSAAGGGAAWLGVWNMYNRMDVDPLVQDSTSSHAYTSATVRSFGNSASNRITFVRGLNEDSVTATFSATVGTVAANASGAVGIGLDSTTVAYPSATRPTVSAAGLTQGAAISRFAAYLSAGQHYLQALEQGDGTNANNFFGGDQGGLSVHLRM